MNTQPNQSQSSHGRAGEPRARHGGFTVMEMLVVMGIIAAIMAVGLPALRSLGQGNELEDALRRLRSNLEQARQKALAIHGTVAVVFVSADLLAKTRADFPADQNGELAWEQTKKLKGGLYTEYRFLALRQAGDQPGQAVRRYVDQWWSLPQKTFLAPELFTRAWPAGLPEFGFPFPYSTNEPVLLRYVAFNHQGRLVLLGKDGEADAGQDFTLPITRGGILYARTPDGDLTPADVTVQEVPAGFSTNSPHLVVVEWLTGRARMERPEVQ